MSEVKKKKMKDFLPAFLMGGLFIVVQGLALLVIRPFESAGIGVFENPDDPLNLVYFFSAMLLFTIVILLISKFWKKQLVQGLILFSTASMAFYVFYPLLTFVVSEVLSLGLSL